MLMIEGEGCDSQLFYLYMLCMCVCKISRTVHLTWREEGFMCQVIVLPKHRGDSLQSVCIKMITSSSSAVKLLLCWFYCRYFICSLWRFVDSEEAVKRSVFS